MGVLFAFLLLTKSSICGFNPEIENSYLNLLTEFAKKYND
jgi:hypothetical protein